MANGTRRPRIKLSVIDRLSGRDSARSSARPAFGQYSVDVRELEDTVRRDLTFLLNTRRAEQPIPPEFPEASASLVTFGLPDFSSYSASDPGDRERIRRAIETAIRQFEPRLSNVTVSMDRRSRRNEQASLPVSSLCYRIRALLKVEPEPEPVAFDAVVETGTTRVAVEMGKLSTES